MSLKKGMSGVDMGLVSSSSMRLPMEKVIARAFGGQSVITEDRTGDCGE